MEKTTLQHIKISEISISGTNPRKHFDEKELTELASSINSHGVLQPIVLRTMKGKQPYELVSGERRLRASKIAQLVAIPAMVASMTDEEALEIQVIENLQRKDLSPMEEAESYDSLIKGPFKYTPDSIAARIGKSVSYIKQRLQLMRLDKAIQKELLSGRLQLGHALQICKIEDPELQKKAMRIATDDGATVKELEQEIAKEILVTLSAASFKISDPDLLPKMGACTTCPFNTSNNKDLFDTVKGAGSCTKPSCFQEKVQINFERNAEEEVKKGNIVIPVAEKNKIFESYNDRTSVKYEYVETDRNCYEHPKNLSYKQVYGGKVKEIVAIDGLGKVRRVYLKNDIDAVKKTMDWYKKKNAPRGGSNNKHLRQNRRNRIANNLRNAAWKKKLDGEDNVVILCMIAIAEQCDNIIAQAKKLDPNLKAENYNKEKAYPAIGAHLDAMKTDKERLTYTLSLIVPHEGDSVNYRLQNILEYRYKISADKFKAQAAKLEAKEFAESKAKKKAAPKKPAKSKK